ncbi:pilus assembly protein N-terminal domain-containing protein [Allosphingosinicella indica]|uniref:Pilus assembly protein CpaC n=1 Tax=Allosphingosinicella indica TaxID=941907 RepID=A0A1X7FYY6_9SPHN|nr:pilus assembly protein N-terminal domain-containing protein [Allosphingosinicella indica]SMF61302.1 pilus assembly protein CpaC [Allosphingosinicella indica]
MNHANLLRRFGVATAMTAVIATSIGGVMPAVALAQSQAGSYRPTTELFLSIGEGELVSLPRNVANVWTSNADVADVQINNSRQIGLFGKANGEATIIATGADGRVVYGAKVRVSQNISSINDVLRAAMPDANISVTYVGQVAVINGTVASPEDSAQAEMLVRTVLNPGVNPNATEGLRILPVNRLRTATPLQVMLKVKIAEVSRTLVKEIGVNLLTNDNSGGFLFGIGRGNAGTISPINGPINPITGLPTRLGTNYTFNNKEGATSLGAAGRLLGLDVLGTLDLAENTGLVTTLAEPTLTALSGETASFLAGGEFPIATTSGLNGTEIEFKEYGVSLAFTPTVLDGGRISMRVRPEVSELTSEGAIRFGGIEIPALSTRRAETTVELGSGQSFMIGGLLRNSSNNGVEKAPFLGNLPIIGALFRSTSFRRNETELMIIVTPYLVKPVSASQIALPTDGFRTANDAERVLLDQQHDARSGEQRPEPRVGPPQTVAPGIGVISDASVPQPPAPDAQRMQQAQLPPQRTAPQQPAAPTPGFSF